MAEISDGVQELAAALAAAPGRLQATVRPVVSKGALNIKNQWRDSVSGLPHLPKFPASISYDLTSASGFVGAEIGPDKDKPQGPLGNLLEFGTSHNPPRWDGARALADEEPRFIAALEDAVEAATLP